MGQSHQNTPQGQRCNDCGHFKAWSEFYRDKSSSTGHKYFCKDCVKAAQRRRTDIAAGRLCKSCLAKLESE